MYNLHYYHYTSLDSALCIFSTKKIRFTNVNDSDDEQEKLHNKKKNLINELKKFYYDIYSGKYDNKEFMLNRYDNIKFIDALKILIDNSYVLESINFDLYQFCVTSKSNSLYHWENYSHNGKGVCIEFDYESIFKDIINNATSFKYSFMDYNQLYDGATIRKEIYCFLSGIIGNGIDVKGDIKEIYKQILYKFCVFRKRNKYRIEKETKLIYVIDKESKIDDECSINYYFKDGKRINYLEITFDKLFDYTNSVIIGYNCCRGEELFKNLFPELNVYKSKIKVSIIKR